MANPVFWDHIEIHVDDIPAYGAFLVKLFGGGRFKQISGSGTSMYLTDRGQAFELKARAAAGAPGRSGFCLPCIRTVDARGHLERLGLSIDEAATNPDGEVLFFTDHEGVQWHVKSHQRMDDYVNW